MTRLELIIEFGFDRDDDRCGVMIENRMKNKKVFEIEDPD